MKFLPTSFSGYHDAFVSVKIVKNLSKWFGGQSRDLPWRANADPYRIWLSEVMLQQTRVSTVIPYFEKFIREFPTVMDLARAEEDQVFSLWAGLGYYSRARNLMRGARAIAARMEAGDGFPKNRAEWLQIPGVGEYTAGAVCSIAYGQREPIVDGNVVRVLSRLHAIRKVDAKRSEIWRRSAELVTVPSADPRILNQALMELGALICTPKNPICGSCPVRGACKGADDPTRFPEKSQKVVWKRVEESRLVLLRKVRGQDEVLLVKNSGKGWREGLWDFPSELTSGMIAKGALVLEFHSKYVVTRHRVERKHSVILVSGRGGALPGGARWFPLDRIPGVPAPVKKALVPIKNALQAR